MELDKKKREVVGLKRASKHYYPIIKDKRRLQSKLHGSELLVHTKTSPNPLIQLVVEFKALIIFEVPISFHFFPSTDSYLFSHSFS